MRLSQVVFVCFALSESSVALAEEFQLPPEVTPRIRAACETDVRRLCMGNQPTVAQVKRCVLLKYFELGQKCQIELVSLGFGQ